MTMSELFIALSSSDKLSNLKSSSSMAPGGDWVFKYPF